MLNQVLIPFGQPVQIKSCHFSSYLRGYEGESRVNVTTNHSTWEKWIITDEGAGTVSIRNAHFNNYMKGSPGDSQGVRVTWNNSSSERWIIEHRGSGTFSIKNAQTNGGYLRARGSGCGTGSCVDTTTTNNSAWERWNIFC